jgi:hypothetical protein
MTAHTHSLAFLLVATLAAASGLVAPVHAQDFDLPAPAWPPVAAGRWLERALPPAAATPVLEAGVVRWHGLDALVTRSLAAGAGWRSLRLSLGLAQTGEPDLGWTTAAGALGAVVPGAGASLRIAARRDRTSSFGERQAAAIGAEAGGGAWFDARDHLHVWASAPQIWLRGSAPPLERPLEIGAAADLGTVTLWLARAGVPGRDAGGREGGLATAAGPLSLWLTARDRPLRGGLGVAARAGVLSAACEVDSHPVLRETARLSLTIGGGR